jgi:hypothetical protein
MFVVDLSNPEELEKTISSYLSMGVCPVMGAQSPGALTSASVELRLPDGTTRTLHGTVIQELPTGFLVQVSGGLDIASLKAASPAPAAAERPTDEAKEEVDVSGSESDYSDVYNKISSLSIPEKRKIARTANRTVRGLLIRDPNKNLHMFVVQNPKITTDEIAEYTRNPGLARDAIKMIAANRSWTSSNRIVFNLVRNPSTPTEVAVALLRRLNRNQLRVLAKGGSVREPVAVAARKLVVGSR